MAFAHFIGGRYRDALTWAESVSRDKPAFLEPASIAAAAAALLGRQEDMRKAMQRVRQLDPALRIANLRVVQMIGEPRDIARWTDALRKAGLPE